MIRVKSIEHVGIAVSQMADAVSFYSLLGLKVTQAKELPRRGVEIAFLPVGECQIELLQPIRPDSDVARFIDQKGEALHHLCLAVEDIELAVQELTEAGVEMIDKVPRMGSRGHKLAFIDPISTGGVLVELIEG